MDSKKLIKGKWVVAGSGPKRRVIEDGAIFVDGDRIKGIGSYSELSERHTYDVELGSGAHIVMPGFVNAHHHGKGISFAQRGYRDSQLEPLLVYWFYPYVVNVDTYYDTLLSCINQIENGITCTLHHYYGRADPTRCSFGEYREDMDRALDAYVDSGMRVAFAPSVADQNRYVYADDDERGFVEALPRELRDRLKIRPLTPKDRLQIRESYFRAIDDLWARFHNHDNRIKVLLGPTNVQWCSADLLRGIKQKAKEKGTRVHMHLSESVYQPEHMKRMYGKTSTRYLADLDFLGPETSFAHCVWLTEEDIGLLADSGAVSVHNPSCNLRVFSGIAPVPRMKERGLDVAFGTDNFGMNDDEDILQDMRLSYFLHRTPGIESTGLTADQVLDMATVHGARVTDFEKEIGELDIDMKADIILLDATRMMTPYFSPKLPIVELILRRAKGLDVDTVLINGEVIMMNRRFLKIDKSKVYDEARTWAEADAGTDRDYEELQKHVKAFYERWPSTRNYRIEGL